MMRVITWLARIYAVWATFTIVLDVAAHHVTTWTQVRSAFVSFWVLTIAIEHFIPDDIPDDE